MVRLNRVVGAGDGELWVKLETMNPGGSVKDRAALGIVLDAERRGVLKPGGTCWLVANRHLPYEDLLASCFTWNNPVTDENGFKIYLAEK